MFESLSFTSCEAARCRSVGAWIGQECPLGLLAFVSVFPLAL